MTKKFVVECSDETMLLIKGIIERNYRRSLLDPKSGLQANLNNARLALSSLQIDRSITPLDAPQDQQSDSTNCTEHPSYRGLRRPRSGCPVCMEVYRRNRPTIG